MNGRGAFGADQFRPDLLPVVRPKVDARYDASCLPLNRWAILGRHRPSPRPPLLDHWWRNPQLPCQLGLATECLAGFFDGMVCIHARTLALLQPEIKHC